MKATVGKIRRGVMKTTVFLNMKRTAAVKAEVAAMKKIEKAFGKRIPENVPERTVRHIIITAAARFIRGISAERRSLYEAKKVILFFRRLVNVSGKESERARNGILCVVPRFLVVAVVELFAEP